MVVFYSQYYNRFVKVDLHDNECNVTITPMPEKFDPVTGGDLNDNSYVAPDGKMTTHKKEQTERLVMTQDDLKKVLIKNPEIIALAKKMLVTFSDLDKDLNNWWEMVLKIGRQKSMTEKEVIWYAMAVMMFSQIKPNNGAQE